MSVENELHDREDRVDAKHFELAPLLVRLGRSRSATPSITIPYDVISDTSRIAGNSILWIAATGTFMTRADGDPTQDEQTDR